MDDTARRNLQRARRTEVCITVDVEFSIAGALTYPKRYRPVSDAPVYGLVAVIASAKQSRPLSGLLRRRGDPLGYAAPRAPLVG